MRDTLLTRRRLLCSAGASLVAGMPAEVVITTGERTALSYMVSPFFEALGHSFNEH